MSVYWSDVGPDCREQALDVVVQVALDVTATQVCNIAEFQALWASAPLDLIPATIRPVVLHEQAATISYVYLPVVLKDAP